MLSNIFVSAIALVGVASAGDIFCSPSGSDNGSGSKSSPLKNIQDAVDMAKAGDTIMLRGGTYKPSKSISIGKEGKKNDPIVVKPYNGEKVVLNGEDMPGTPAPLGGKVNNKDRGIFHVQDAAYWEFYDLEFINGPYGVYIRDASDTYWEGCKTHDNYETGFQIQGDASNNVVVNLDSYMNRDPRKNGESADGFAVKEGSGEGNMLIGGRLWANVDDGLDFWEFKSKVVVRDTISFENGFNHWGFSPYEGDGNGFKLGGGNAGDKGPADHLIENCISFGNSAKGYTDNGQPGNMEIRSNIAFDNGDTGFKFSTDKCELENNIAALNSGSTSNSKQVSLSGQSEDGNSWNSNAVWTESSFVSTDSSRISRDSNGELHTNGFLQPILTDNSDDANISWTLIG